ncbi:hypothetical protein [Streptomyces sp. NBC_00239]|uniref:hypothetical protein n=1 Tax=Streptomyces sp. NBC_00239 TaxID=2903640 RepID=UPI002E2A3DD5|nr:hypothetical protein [Streptomyces sp. NBC_00239]
MQAQEVEQAVDVHGRNSVQVQQEVVLVHGHVVQRVLEHFSRTLVELPGGADLNRAGECGTLSRVPRHSREELDHDVRQQHPAARAGAGPDLVKGC